LSGSASTHLPAQVSGFVTLAIAGISIDLIDGTETVSLLSGAAASAGVRISAGFCFRRSR